MKVEKKWENRCRRQSFDDCKVHTRNHIGEKEVEKHFTVWEEYCQYRMSYSMKIFSKNKVK